MPVPGRERNQPPDPAVIAGTRGGGGAARAGRLCISICILGRDRAATFGAYQSGDGGLLPLPAGRVGVKGFGSIERSQPVTPPLSLWEREPTAFGARLFGPTPVASREYAI